MERIKIASYSTPRIDRASTTNVKALIERMEERGGEEKEAAH